MFADETSLPSVILPSAKEELAEKGVQWLLLAAKLLASAAVLLLECGQEPFQHQESTLRWIFLTRWCHKK